MKRFSKLPLLSVCIFLLTLNTFGAADLSELTNTIEANLSQSLKLPTGPATQAVQFHFKDAGLFIVVTTDLTMGSSVRTPFGEQQTKKKVAVPGAAVREALKNALLSCRSLSIPLPADDYVHVVLVNRSLFNRPDQKAQQDTTFKAYIRVSDLKGNSDPANKIVVE